MTKLVFLVLLAFIIIAFSLFNKISRIPYQVMSYLFGSKCTVASNNKSRVLYEQK
jgi:ABC-type Mn2+/Zn2+ transport system permease subunit